MFKLNGLTIALGAVLAVTLWSCGGKGGAKNENVHLNDFEAFYGFNEMVDKGKAHSGECYYTIDSTMDYSISFIKKFNKISPKKYNKVKFSAYVLLPAPNTSIEMVIQIWDPKLSPIKVHSAPVTGQVGINKWVEVSLELPLTNNLYNPENDLRCFFFNPNRSQVFVDDFKVELFE